MTENLCQTCGSPRVPSNHEWVCLTPNCALRLIKELQGDKKALALKAHQRRVTPSGDPEVETRQNDLALVDTAILEGYRAGLERAEALCRARADRYAAQVEQREPGSGGRIVADARSAEAEACADAIRALGVE